MAATAFYIKEEDLMCPICLECWISKDARILSCQHTFCLDCLSSLPMEDSDIRCPSCRQSIFVPEGNVTKLQRNLIKSSILELKVDKPLCKKHNEEGSFFCQTHDAENICSKCFETDHKDCSKITMVQKQEFELEIQRKMSTYIEEKEDLLKELEVKEKNDILLLQTKYAKVKQDILENYEIKTKKFLKDLNNGKNIDDAVDKSRTELKLDTGFNFNYEILNSSIKPIAFKMVGKSSKADNLLTDMLDFSKLLKFQERFSVIENLGNDKWIFENSLNSIDHLKYILNGKNSNECILIESKFKDLPENTLISIKLYNPTDLSATIKLLKSFPFIQEFNMIMKVNILNETVSKLFDSLFMSSDNLHSLSLNQFQFGEEKCKEVCNLLNHCSNIKKINFSSYDDSHVAWSTFFPVNLPSSKSLTEISFSSCNLDEGDCNHLGNMIGNCPNIEKVKFHSNENMKKGIVEIFKGLIKSKNSLKYIEFSKCKLIAYQCRELASLIKNCSKIETLNVGDNEFMNDGFPELMKSLSKSAKNLKNLELYSCSITNEQCKEVCKLLKLCKKIETIDLSCNKKCKEVIDGIFDSLKESSSTLRGININCCNLALTDRFIKFFSKCRNLKSIHLSSNSFEIGVFDKFCDSMRMLTNTLEVLVLKECKFSKFDLSYLFKSIKSFSKLKVLILNLNSSLKDVTDDLCENIVQLEGNLEDLHLKDCELSNDQEERLKKILSINLYF